MKIDVRKIHPYRSVAIVEGSTTIDLGLLNDDEIRELAAVLREAAQELDDKIFVEKE